MLHMAPPLLDQLDNQNRNTVEGQVGFFDTAEAQGDAPVTPPDLPELPWSDILQMEKDATGMYLSGHPLTPYEETAKALRVDRLDRILAAVEENSDRYADDSTVKLLCLVSGVRAQKTKAGATMAYVQLEDLCGTIEMIAFPKQYTQHEALLQTGQVLLVRGRLDVGETLKLIAEKIEPVTATTAPKQPSAKAGLYLRLTGEAQLAAVQTALQPHRGDLPVYIRFTDSGKLVRAPREWAVQPSNTLTQTLIRLLGKDNVAIVD
jgi:DNA polymerase-3 subunit alpha